MGLLQNSLKVKKDYFVTAPNIKTGFLWANYLIIKGLTI